MRLRHRILALVLLIILAACGTQEPPEPTPATAAPPSQPPTITGTITEWDEFMLVEQQPGAMIGEKIYFRLDDATAIFQRANDAFQPGVVDDLAVGQRVDVWADLVQTSYPGYATATDILIVARADAATPTPGIPDLPDREPDVVGTLTDAANTLTVDNDLTFMVTPSTRFLERHRDTLETLDPRDIREGQEVEVWLGGIHETSLRQVEVLVVVAAD